MRILVVDDSSFMRTMLRRVLEDLGHKIVGEASNGAEAFERYKELKPDLVTMDITMPDTNGLEGLKLIMDYDSDAKVIMCSAMGQQLMIIEAVQLGVKDFIVKPFTPDRVKDAVSRITRT